MSEENKTKDTIQKLYDCLVIYTKIDEIGTYLSLTVLKNSLCKTRRRKQDLHNSCVLLTLLKVTRAMYLPLVSPWRTCTCVYKWII